MIPVSALYENFDINFKGWVNEMLHAPLPKHLILNRGEDYDYNKQNELTLSVDGAKKVISYMNGVMCNQVDDYFISR